MRCESQYRRDLLGIVVIIGVVWAHVWVDARVVARVIGVGSLLVDLGSLGNRDFRRSHGGVFDMRTISRRASVQSSHWKGDRTLIACINSLCGRDGKAFWFGRVYKEIRVKLEGESRHKGTPGPRPREETLGTKRRRGQRTIDCLVRSSDEDTAS